MKRILSVIVLTLAFNFALAAGGVGWLASSGHLTKARVAELRKVLFPPPATQPTATTQPAVEAAPPDPAERLGALVARAALSPPADREAAVQQATDATLVSLDDRRRELLDLKQQVELAQQQVDRDRAAVERDRKAFTAERDAALAAAGDKGFQDSLQLYKTLPPKQVKAIFMTLPDETVQQYLQAMDAKQVAKVMKEYKTPADVARLQLVLERIRLARAATAQPTPPPGGPADPNATAAVPAGR